MKKVCAFLVLLAMISSGMRADVIKGVVVDAATSEPIGGATVTLSVRYEYGSSVRSMDVDSLGRFECSVSGDGRYSIRAMMIGYNDATASAYAYGKGSNDTIIIDTLRLKPTELMLKGVLVSAKAKRFTMKGDTIIFHPEAFKMEEGARLEELVRKLPGMENRDGKLYWNGKPIRMIMNGKDVFGSNADILGQLPVEAIHKLKVYDKASDQERRTGRKDGDDDQVLDVNIKPGFMDKWYGKAEAAYVTAKRYDASLEATYLSDHDPFFVFLNANNANRRVMRTMSMGSWGGISSFGKQQYGNFSYQHTWHPDFLSEWQNNGCDINGNMLHSDGWSSGRSIVQNYLPNEAATYSLQRHGEYAHLLSPRLEVNFYEHLDTANYIYVSGNASYEKNDSHSYTLSSLSDEDPLRYGSFPLQEIMGATLTDSLYRGLVNRERYYNTSTNDRLLATLNGRWEHYLGKKGSVTTAANIQYSHANSRSHNNRSLDYVRENRSSLLFQYSRMPSRKLSAGLSESFRYWLLSNVQLSLNYSINYENNSEKRNYFSAPDEALLRDSADNYRDPSNTYDSHNRKLKQQLSLVPTINLGSVRINPRIDWNYTHETMDYRRARLDTSATRNSGLWQPSLSVSWKIDRSQNIDFNSRYSSAEPSLLSTLDYIDDADPLSITMGNPRVHRSHDHTTSLAFRKVSVKHQLNYNLSIEYFKQINPVVYVSHYTPATGVYRSRPENVRGGDRWSLNTYFYKALGRFHIKNDFQISLSTNYGYLTAISDDDAAHLNRSRTLTIIEKPEFGYENDWLEASLYGECYLWRYRYSQAEANNSTPFDYNYGIKGKIKYKSWNINTELSDNARTGHLATSMNRHRVLWNAGLAYKFLHNKAQLSLYMDDILNQYQTFYSTVGAYSRSEQWTSHLHHTFELRFTYRFDAKEKKK